MDSLRGYSDLDTRPNGGNLSKGEWTAVGEIGALLEATLLQITSS